MREELERAGLTAVDLPEHGAAHLPLSGLGGRSLAALIDGLWIALGGLALAVLVLFVAAGVDTGGLLGPGGLQAVAIPLSAVAALAPIAYPLLFGLFAHGQTPGKRALDLRVVGADGLPATPGQILLRNVMRVVDFLPALYALGGVVVFLSRNEQRLGDLVAGTVVVREDPRAFAELASTPPAPRAAGADLHGVPDPLLRAAALLAAPDRDLDEAVFEARRATLLAAIRSHRPDLAAEDDQALWARVARGVGAG